MREQSTFFFIYPLYVYIYIVFTICIRIPLVSALFAVFLHGIAPSLKAELWFWTRLCCTDQRVSSIFTNSVIQFAVGLYWNKSLSVKILYYTFVLPILQFVMFLYILKNWYLLFCKKFWSFKILMRTTLIFLDQFS